MRNAVRPNRGNEVEVQIQRSDVLNVGNNMHGVLDGKQSGSLHVMLDGAKKLYVLSQSFPRSVRDFA